MNRREAIIQKDKLRKQEEIEKFLNDVNVLHNGLDNIVYPSMSITIESENCYINYHVVKIGDFKTYSLTQYRKEHPFDIYYSKKYNENEIPEKHMIKFNELSKYFI